MKEIICNILNNKTIFAVAVERWCRLRGNLLFYFKSTNHLLYFELKNERNHL
jgi:hypothetical protein